MATNDKTVSATDKVEAKRTNTSVAAVIDVDLHEKLEAFRWANRMTKAQAVKAALEEFLADK